MHLFFEMWNVQLLINTLYGWSEIYGQFALHSFISFFFNIIKVKHYCTILLYCYFLLYCYISSFLHTSSLLVPYAYFSIESVVSILLSSFELKAVLLIFSVKTLCLSLLNLCCVLILIYSFFMNSL